MHTRRLHLLIVDRSLMDYHHEHPTPTGRPGEFAFTFTPRKPGPYRVWADVVPAETSMQEFVVADLPSDEPGEPLADRADRFADDVAGLHFQLELGSPGQPVRAGEIVRGRLTVTDAAGKPFTQLRPVMGAFAHLVGFCADGKTVLHLHPLGLEPKDDSTRGGPTLDFRLYPPVAGFVRLYAQVNVGGEMRFARFGVNVQPARGEPASAVVPRAK
jgi:hypothetical protein